MANRFVQYEDDALQELVKLKKILIKQRKHR